MKFKSLKTSVVEEREKEQLRADFAKQQSDLEYLSMMSGIEIPTEDENMEGVTE